MQANSLGELYSSRQNGLNLLRLLLALAVILSHAPLILGVRDPYKWSDLEIGGWAVAGFFAISGWLITGSRLNLHFAPFMWRRCLRILPAFWMALFITAAIFAPIAWLVEQRNINLSASFAYALNNSTLWIVQPTIGDTLSRSPTTTWNLSLWTLSWEMICYISVGLMLFSKRIVRNPLIMASVFAGLSVANLLIRSTDLLPTTLAMEAGLRLGTFFVAGATLRLYADRIPSSATLAIGSGALIAILYPLDLIGSVGALPLAYLCLYIGLKTPLQDIGRRNDISYGVYVYAFPVGQLIILLGGSQLNVFWFTALNALLVIPLAWMSWKLVEQPALKWKGLVSNRSMKRAPIARNPWPPEHSADEPLGRH